MPDLYGVEEQIKAPMLAPDPIVKMAEEVRRK